MLSMRIFKWLIRRRLLTILPFLSKVWPIILLSPAWLRIKTCKTKLLISLGYAKSNKSSICSGNTTTPAPFLSWKKANSLCKLMDRWGVVSRLAKGSVSYPYFTQLPGQHPSSPRKLVSCGLSTGLLFEMLSLPSYKRPIPKTKSSLKWTNSSVNIRLFSIFVSETKREDDIDCNKSKIWSGSKDLPTRIDGFFHVHN